MTTLMSDLRLPLHFLLLLLFCPVSSSFGVPTPSFSFINTVACRPHQIQAFTEFKNEFDTRSCNHSDSSNGISCDNSTGAITMLRLRACLRGTLKSNSSLFKLHHLRYLNLSDNDFTSSSLPSGFGNLNRLEVLSLSFNGFIGQVPSSLNNLSQLSVLDLSRNMLTGSFPFVRNLTKLSFLRLSRNRINGKLPAWLWKLPFLTAVRLFDNFLNGFESSAEVLVNSSVQLLDLGLNSFEGALPNLPLSIITFSARLNSFSGHIPLSTCNSNSLMNLDLSYNNFTGPIPQCLSNLMSVNLRKNNFEGSLPDMFYAGFTARLLDVGYNQLTGKLPKSLVNCSSLEILSVDHNRIEDTFPFWLKALPNLQVLILRSNKFYGSISPPHQGPLAFPELRIFEISDNNFTGSLSPSYFVNWKASSGQMNEDGSMYMRNTDKASYSRKDLIDLQYKGLSVEQSQVLTFYAAIDFSGNRIEGQIPESIGLLKGLIALNLSNNAFTGHIPLSLANLTNLQSLDMSRNQLSGTIPNGLKTLSFLAYVNVSHNQLKGEIPQGTQITGQPKSSFEGNAGLCGLPLEESCFGTTTPPKQQPKQEDEEEEDNEVLSWKGVAIGYGLGVLFGLAIAQVIASYKSEWLFTKIICLK